MQLSDDQRMAIEALYAFIMEARGHTTLGGYAGVGKTTLLAVFRRLIHKKFPKMRVGFCSYTGRAARVLQVQLKLHQAIVPKDGVSTIHSLIYSPVIDDKNRISGWKLKDSLKYDLIILDEASMVSKAIWEDLTSFEIPIVAVGDHGQLPPIESGFSLMNNPEIRLEKIHRQAQDNPIIKVSLLARENGYIPPRRFGNGVVKLDKSDPLSGEEVESALSQFSPEMLVLCGYNKTRNQLNQFIRGHLGFETQQPAKGDRVICLKNNHKKHIFNGMLGTVTLMTPINADWNQAEIAMDHEDLPFSGPVYKHQFGSLEQIHSQKPKLRELGDFFDFGYALTVHKAQGSQANQVIVFEERFAQMDDEMWRRWLYTAVTRAEARLLIIGEGKRAVL